MHLKPSPFLANLQQTTLQIQMVLTSSPDLKPLWTDFEYKPHQLFGVGWLLAREKAPTEAQGGILADEMGLGKTIQIAGLLRNNITAPRQMNLLVAPVAVLEQWKAVLRRTGFSVQVPAPSGVSWLPEELPAGATAPPKKLWPIVCVMGYEKMTRSPILSTAYSWHRIIFDEAHRLAGAGSTCGHIAQRIEATHRWLLTATPIINDMSDLRRLFKILRVEAAANNVMDADLLKTYILARTMEQLRTSIPDAPPKPFFNTISLPFETEAEAEFYRGKVSLITRRWESLQAQEGAGAALERLKLFMRLRQLSLHPQIYVVARQKALKGLGAIPDWDGGSTKFSALRRLVCSEPGKRWIIFGHFTEEMRMLKATFEAEPTVGRVQIYNGGLSHKEKAAVVEATHQPLEPGKGEVLLVQLQSGGTGLNLQHFNRIVFTGPWWTSALMEQAVGRAVRIGQHEAVGVYRLTLKEEEQLNIDAFMMAKAETKGGLCQQVLQAATKDISPCYTLVPITV